MDVLVSVAQAQQEVGDARGADQTIERALTTAERIADDDERSGPLLWIARAQVAAGDIQQALATARRVPGEYLRAAAFAEVLEAQAEAGDTEGSAHTLEMALATAARIELESLRRLSYYDIAELQAKFGDASGAKRTLELILEMVELELEDYHRDYHRALGLAYHASNQAAIGNVEAATRLVERAFATAEQIDSHFFARLCVLCCCRKPCQYRQGTGEGG